MSILRLDGVRREIGDFVILDSVTAALSRGERVGLVGGNGAGKTTLLEIIAGRESATRSRCLDEQDLPVFDREPCRLAKRRGARGAVGDPGFVR